MTEGEKPVVRTARIVILSGDISDDELKAVQEYCINPVESRLASMEKPDTLADNLEEPADVMIVDGFIDMNDKELEQMIADLGLAMDYDDIKFCQDYFKNTEKRNPTV